MSILGALMILAAILIPTLSIVTGVVALTRISRSGGSLRGRGVAVAGIVLATFGLFSLSFVMFLG